MATLFLELATFYLGLATLFLGLATFFLENHFFQNGYILVPHLIETRQKILDAKSVLLAKKILDSNLISISLYL